MPLCTLEDFTTDLAETLGRPADAGPPLEAGATSLARLLASDGALSRYVDLLQRGRGPWLLHQDPSLGFLVTLTTKARGNTTGVHHHGEAWSLYGILDGEEVVHRYTRHDDGSRPDWADVRPEADHLRRTGDVEIEPAFAIHNETTAPARDTIAVIVRGRDVSQVTHEYFDLATGAVTTRLGNAAVPLPRD